MKRFEPRGSQEWEESKREARRFQIIGCADLGKTEGEPTQERDSSPVEDAL